MQCTTKSFWTYTQLRRTVFALSVLTVLLLGTLLGLVIAWSLKRQKIFDYKERTVCLPCYDLQSSKIKSLVGFTLRHESDVNNVTCCASFSKILDRLIGKHAASKHHDLQPIRIISSIGDDCKDKAKTPQKPYAKMTGLSFTDMKNTQDNIVRWNTTEHGGNVNPLDGKIFIIEPGFYYVFSQLKLQNDDSDIEQSYSVNLHSYQRGTLKTILENSKSVCETTAANRETVSTMGAVFQLEKHDKIFVQSSHIKHLVPCEHSNAFGVYMV